MTFKDKCKRVQRHNEDVRVAKLFVRKKAWLRNDDVCYRSAVEIKIVSVDNNGVMVCKVVSTCCD